MATSNPVPVLGDRGARVDLLIRQGGTFGPHRIEIRNEDGTPADLTGSTLRSQMRRTALDSAVLADFAIVLDATELHVAYLNLTAAQTAAIPCGESPADPLSRATWDLEWHDAAGRVVPLMWGAVTIHREATRA